MRGFLFLSGLRAKSRHIAVISKRIKIPRRDNQVIDYFDIELVCSFGEFFG